MLGTFIYLAYIILVPLREPVLTRAEKLDVHLEKIIIADFASIRLTSKDLQTLKKVATAEQKRRAYHRALVHDPLLVGDERNP